EPKAIRYHLVFREIKSFELTAQGLRPWVYVCGMGCGLQALGWAWFGLSARRSEPTKNPVVPNFE
ncbi:MAG: hypothetical protein ACOCWJ_04830, partial [Verrucomicrobiota bacterium]